MTEVVTEVPLEMEARKARLIEIIAEMSLIRREGIRLTSGRESNFYFNMKPTLFDPEGADLIAAWIVDILGGENFDFVTGLELGAVPLVANVCLKSANTARPIPGFIVRKTKKTHGTLRRIEGLKDRAILKGKIVIAVDDVTTTGSSSVTAAAVARAQGCRAKKVISVVDRLEGAEENLRHHGLELISLLTVRDFGL